MSRELDLLKEAVKILEEKENLQCVGCVDNTGKVELSTVLVGDIIRENGRSYKVLDHFENGTTLIVPVDFMLENVKFDSESKNYNISNLKEEIDSKCLPVFESDFGSENIVEHEVDLTSVDMQNEFGTCKCKVRPFTFDEARKYNHLLVNEELDDCCWTCTPWSTEGRGWKWSIAVVSPSGYFINFGYYYDLGVRPFCIFPSSIFESEEK